MLSSFYFYLLVAFAYLVGSISTAIITCKLLGLNDPRRSGSNNPGATNVLRLGGKKAAIITLTGDVLKGFLPVLLAKYLDIEGAALYWVALFAFLGHVFPLYYGFKGGKGVATFYGVALALSWQSALFAIIIWLVMAFLIKISSLAALVSIVATPFIFYYFSPIPLLASGFIAFMSFIVLWRHRTNIKALLDGSEEKIISKN